MIRCRFIRKNGIINSVEVSGHSYYEEAGKDIVCSAVSALSIAAVNGIVEYSGISVKHEIKDGYLFFQLPNVTDTQKKVEINAILETLYLGIKSIEENYKEYIEIID